MRGLVDVLEMLQLKRRLLVVRRDHTVPESI